ncbi:MAG: hypothetical protein HXS53_05205 [Theionarchaea archaeon]|nr:hypothetical protein [Theionarchaea archaeon]
MKAEDHPPTQTDVLYDLIDYIHDQRYWMVLIVFACLLLAPAGLLLNGLSWIVLTIRSQGTITFFSLRGVFFGINILMCILLIYFGVKQARFLRRWNVKLKKIEELEKRIFEEVVSEE